MIQDDRIGTLDKYPKTTVSGRKYTRPVSTLVLGGGFIAVLDDNGVIYPDEVAELKGLVEDHIAKQAKPKRASKKKATKDKATNENEQDKDQDT